MTIEDQLARTIRAIVRDEIRRHAVLPPPGEEWSDFQHAVYDTVFMIPYGKVATYGGVARKSGHEGAAQGVGNALAAIGYGVASPIPWWRVVRSTRELPEAKDPVDRRHRLYCLKHEGIELDEHSKVPAKCVCDW